MTKYIAKWYDGEVVSGVLHDSAIECIIEANEQIEKTGEKRSFVWFTVEEPEPVALDLLELTSPMVTTQQDTKSVNSRNGE